jgi:hypothetical protein
MPSQSPCGDTGEPFFEFLSIDFVTITWRLSIPSTTKERYRAFIVDATYYLLR